jgi:hypothetical protein
MISDRLREEDATSLDGYSLAADQVTEFEPAPGEPVTADCVRSVGGRVEKSEMTNEANRETNPNLLNCTRYRLMASFGRRAKEPNLADQVMKTGSQITTVLLPEDTRAVLWQHPAILGSPRLR